MELNSANVEAVIKDCLFKVQELPAEGREQWAQENGVVVQGVVGHFAFHRGRLKKNKSIIVDWIAQLPAEFDKGWSFLEMCNTQDGEQWTGMHRAVGQLACLGMAAGVLECCAPREMWAVLPGGVPYYRRII